MNARTDLKISTQSSKIRILYLFNKVLAKTIENACQGKGHDSWCFGMLRLPKFGLDADYLEIEQFIPAWLANFLRKHILTMHYAHLPLFPLFFKYDAVFTSTAYSSLILKALLGIKKFKWVILDFNVLGTIGNEASFRQKIYAWAVSKADGVVCISKAAQEAMKKRFPKLADKIIFLHEATDTNYFKPRGMSEEEIRGEGWRPDVVNSDESHRDELIKSYGNELRDSTNHEKISILSVGNYGRDFSTIIEATKDLNIECKLATKILPLEKYKKSAILMPEIIPSHVTIKTYSHAEMLKAYENAKIVVVALTARDDHYDSVGTFALGEAMSMGKAVIVSHTKSMESYITDGLNGCFVPWRDVQTMRAKIMELLQNEPLRSRLGIEARKFAVKYLDADKFALNLANYFKTILEVTPPKYNE